METDKAKEEEKALRQQHLREVIVEENKQLITSFDEKMSQMKDELQESINDTNSRLKSAEDGLKIIQDSDKIQREALQAVLRDRLYLMYSNCATKGYTTLSERDNFSNMYDKYHNLGANGVMDSTYDRFLELPTEEEYTH